MSTQRAGIPQRHLTLEPRTMTIPTGCTELIVQENCDNPLYSVTLQLSNASQVTFDCHTRESAERLKAIIDTCRCVGLSGAQAPKPTSSNVYRDAIVKNKKPRPRAKV